jgi:O-antigen/teichoic acid export membrane protein
MRQLVSFGGWVTITSLLAPIILSLDRFALGAMVGAAAVSIYSIPYNLVSRMNILPVSLASALFPRFASAGEEQAADLQVESVSVLVTLLTPLSILLIMVLGPFLHIWIGRELATQATPLGYIFVIGFWMNSIAYVPYVHLEARGRPDLIAKLVIAYLIPYVALLFGCLWAFGIVGAAIATSLRYFFDPTLFVLAGTFRRVLPVLAVPVALMLAATATALVFPWTSTMHWALLASLLALSLFVSLRALPAPLQVQLRRLRSSLPWGREFA